MFSVHLGFDFSFYKVFRHFFIPSSDLKAKMSAGVSHGEEAIVSSGNDNEGEQITGNHTGKTDEYDPSSGSALSNFLWHGGSVWDAWFSCASNQVQASITLQNN